MLRSEVLINLGGFFIASLLIGLIFIIAGIFYQFAIINRVIIIIIGLLFLIGSISLFRKIQKLKWG